MKLAIDPKVKEQGVSLAYSVIEFKNEAHNEKIWQEMLNPLLKSIESTDTLDTIKENPQIITTKKVYKLLGKTLLVLDRLLIVYGGGLFSKKDCTRLMHSLI